MPRRRALITILTSLSLFLLLLHINRSRNAQASSQEQLHQDVESQHVAVPKEPTAQHPPSSVELDPPTHHNPTYIFAFGDSYTTYGFDSNLAPPSLSNPYGNRAALPYDSSAQPDPATLVTNTPKWLDHLLTDRALAPEGTIAWNYGRGASTIDGDVVPPQFWGAKAMVDQMEEWVQSVAETGAWKYGEEAKMMRERSVFAIWFGINDVYNTAEDGNVGDLEALYRRVLDKYIGVLDRCHENGGDQFVVMGLPPIERTPQLLGMGPPHTTVVARAISMFNRLLEERVTRWVASNALAKVTVLDMHTVFTLALDAEPHDTKCTIAERETCLWIDGFHPAPRLQRVVATEVSGGLHRMGLWL